MLDVPGLAPIANNAATAATNDEDDNEVRQSRFLRLDISALFRDGGCGDGSAAARERAEAKRRDDVFFRRALRLGMRPLPSRSGALIFVAGGGTAVTLSDGGGDNYY